MLSFIFGFLTACIMVGYVGYFVSLPEETRHKSEMAMAVQKAYDEGYRAGRSMPRYDVRE